mgnify:CR=1 FL=1
MSRQARIYSDTGVYHIMMRGNDKRTIFLDDNDRRSFISTLYEKLLKKTQIFMLIV